VNVLIEAPGPQRMIAWNPDEGIVAWGIMICRDGGVSKVRVGAKSVDLLRFTNGGRNSLLPCYPLEQGMICLLTCYESL